jgi:hypothetical protein
VKIFSLPYFIASKWEAYKGRGNNDYRTSKDFEDLVYIFENVDDLQPAIAIAPQHLLTYFKNEFSKVIDTPAFQEGLYVHMQQGYLTADAKKMILMIKNTFGID